MEDNNKENDMKILILKIIQTLKQKGWDSMEILEFLEEILG